MSDRHVNLDNARYDDQREVMRDSAEDGVCPFCIESLRKYHRQPILEEGKHWIVTENQWPYKHTNAHYLLIAKKHVETVSELSLDAFEDLGRQVKRLVIDRELDYGGLAMRFGDTRYTGATVNHLHAHLLQAAKDIPEDEKVRFKLSG